MIRFQTTSCLAFIAAFAALGWSTPLHAQQHSLAMILQDEPLELPPENTAMYSTAGVVSVELDMLAALDRGTATDVMVTVIRPDGSEDRFSPNSEGVIEIDDATPGPHALVANGKGVHGSTLFYFDEQPTVKADENVAADVAKVEPKTPERARMTLAVVREKELKPFVNRIRDVGQDDDVESISESVDAGGKFDYRVSLNQRSTLRGRVLSFIKRPLSNGVEGTKVAVFREGDRVASTTCDPFGRWEIEDLEPGVYGVIAAGAEGYAAFGFDAVSDRAMVRRDNQSANRLVAKQEDELQFEDLAAPVDNEGTIEELPIVLIPRPYCPKVVDSIVRYYPSLKPAVRPAYAGGALAAPVGGSVVPGAGVGVGGFGGASVTSAGAATAAVGSAGGFGGIGGLAAVGAVIGATVAATDDDDDNIIGTPPLASPAVP